MNPPLHPSDPPPLSYGAVEATRHVEAKRRRKEGNFVACPLCLVPAWEWKGRVGSWKSANAPEALFGRNQPLLHRHFQFHSLAIPKNGDGNPRARHPILNQISEELAFGL